MLDIDRPDEILDGEFVNLDEPACTELVPVTAVRALVRRNRRRGPIQPSSRS